MRASTPAVVPAILEYICVTMSVLAMMVVRVHLPKTQNLLTVQPVAGHVMAVEVLAVLEGATLVRPSTKEVVL